MPVSCPSITTEKGWKAAQEGGGIDGQAQGRSPKDKHPERSEKAFRGKRLPRTSVADIVQATGFPAGSLYTYFSGKEEIVHDIIEELDGIPDELRSSIVTCAGRRRSSPSPRPALPSLFADIDLINISSRRRSASPTSTRSSIPSPT